MSTTKDKSQAELLAEREYPDPKEPMAERLGLIPDYKRRNDMRTGFVKGFSAGQAERDELVKALQEARLLLPSAINEETSTEWDNRVGNSLLKIDMVLSRYTNP